MQSTENEKIKKLLRLDGYTLAKDYDNPDSSYYRQAYNFRMRGMEPNGIVRRSPFWTSKLPDYYHDHNAILKLIGKQPVQVILKVIEIIASDEGPGADRALSCLSSSPSISADALLQAVAESPAKAD